MMVFEVLGHEVLISGFRGVRVEDPAGLLEELRAKPELRGVCFQLLNADLVAGPEHLVISVFNALRAFELGLNVSSDLGLEILTFASGQRQISRAIRKMGLRKGLMNVALVLVAKPGSGASGAQEAISETLRALGGREDDSVLEVGEEKARLLVEEFGIRDVELRARPRAGGLPEAVKALVLERVALSMAYR